jgi:hypothetical protein
MNITPIYNASYFKTDSKKEPMFRHGGESFWKSDYSKKEKLVVAATTAKGVFLSLGILAKCKGHSVKPKEFWKFLKTVDIDFTSISTMGVGTCLGGLLGGYLIDKNPANRKAKRREAVMQFGNILIPIGTVKLTDMALNSLKIGAKSVKDKSIRAVSTIGAVVAGIYIANFAMNKISNILFNNKSNERGIKGTDLFPHVDDLLASGGYILPGNNLVHKIGRIVPFALMVAGNEIGNKKAEG